MNPALKISFALVIAFIVWHSCKREEEHSKEYSVEEQVKQSEEMNKFISSESDSMAKIEDARFAKTKAGKIHRKHPQWSKADCIEVANKNIWIGMHIDMMYYMHGKPNSVNTSNYGNGNRYQYCWHDLTPSFYYCGEDGIVFAYN
jgi:uncharacterized membrane-anchored protein